VSANYTADDVIHLLNLKPLTIEGGFFRETYRSPQSMNLPLYRGPRSLATAIYYLLTPETFSRIHRVPGEEIFHFYLGDPVEMLQLNPNGAGEIITMGHDLRGGMTVQYVVPGGVWQGVRLKAGGRFALMGTTMSPGFEYEDYTAGNRDDLVRAYPGHAALISALCPA